MICYGAEVAEGEKRLVLVTGGSGGLGRAMARAFARAGYDVVICGRNQKTLQTTAEEISRLGGEIRYFLCDVTNKNEVESLAREIGRELGTVQVLINNAGIARAASFLEMPDSLWEEILKTNLTGAYNCCKVFLAGYDAIGLGPHH